MRTIIVAIGIAAFAAFWLFFFAVAYWPSIRKLRLRLADWWDG